ncbi:hypothetical protein [Hyalangium rubrum]|uniref:Uncharacterized protein n=1 Tax=Hyalangium rubrum TaxID=3103134 RepID=A0ABU5H7F0_9BACT|nr:hypothetical protein [Hyalangium sp. s54d21]MDY7229057.1 hypothetical protein [Hyalangium sp. s54d21]
MTTPEFDTALDPQRLDASNPRAAAASQPYEWGTRPPSTRRDKPLVEDVDDLWEESFASW